MSEHPNDAAGWYTQGLTLRKQGDNAGATAAFNQAIKLKPDFADACFELANTLEASGPVGMALKTYAHLLKISPNHKKGRKKLLAFQRALEPAKEWNKKALAYLQQGDCTNAAAAYGQSIALHGGFPEVYANYAVALYNLRRFDEAFAAVKEAIRLKPAYPEAYNTLANIYMHHEQYAVAIIAFRQALIFKPDYLHPLVNLGQVLYKTGDFAAAVECYEKVLAIDPSQPEALAEIINRLSNLCRWENMEKLSQRLVKLVAETEVFANPFTMVCLAPAAVQLTNMRKWTHAKYAQNLPYNPRQPLPADTRKNGKLRIGYLSSDFHHHATAFLISEMLEQHARDRFEVYAYSTGVDDAGPQRSRIMHSADKFIELRGLDHRAALRMIIEDAPDILVDLKGYTMGTRIELLSHRPAPLQMHYLGYPGTLGNEFIDYFIADSIAAPPGMDAMFSEKLIRLPHSYQINDRKRALPADSTRAQHGLPEEGFVFCSFNQPYKIMPGLYNVWMRLLKQVPGSVLWLCDKQPEAIANLKKEAEIRGVSADRIIIAPVVSQAEHLNRYRHADLLIDTFPVCGHTTASDALWCGVPVVTMAGDSFVSRVAASLLAAVGLPELVAKDPASYEVLILELARNPEKLARLKKHLSDGRMHFPLFDSAATTRAIEAAYLHMAELHRAGQMPRGFTLSPDLAIQE